MKRLAICALGVMRLAGVATAQDATLWLQWQGQAPEDHEKCLTVSETGVIQL